MDGNDQPDASHAGVGDKEAAGGRRPVRGPARVRRTALRVVAITVATTMLAVACQVVRNSGTEPLGAVPVGALRLATHNVHYILLNESSGRWSVGDWEARRDALDLAFKALGADLAAFQEMESFAGGDESEVNLALEWLLERNSGYAAAAVGDPSAFPSTQPILFRRDRLELLEQGWFFFSETPDVIYSRTFDGSYSAFASWARFRVREKSEEGGAGFRVINVHVDFRSGENRRRSIELVASRVAPWIEAGERVFLAGDLNARLGSSLHERLEAIGFTFVPVTGATYHFDRGINLFGAIDHIAYGPGIAGVGLPSVLRQRFDGEWPSDHYPLVADFRLE